MTEERYQKAEFGAWIGIVGNIGLAGLKGTIGYLSGSKALVADALYSTAEVAGSVALLLGLKTAKRPPDEDQLNGHGRTQTFAAIIVSVILLFVGLEIAMTSIKAIYFGVVAPPRAIALVAIVISIVVKEVLFQYKYRLGKRLSSQALISNALEHRSDVYSSVAVIAGVLGAIIGKYSGYTSLYYLDPIAGLFIAVLVLRMGYRYIVESIYNTLDHELHEDDARALIQTVQTIKGVIAVDELRAREQGHYVIVDVTISVNPRISVLEGHDIAKLAKQALMKRFHHVTDVFIHVNPYDPGYPYKNNVDSDLDNYPILLH